MLVRPKQLTQEGASSGQVLAWDGSKWAPASAAAGTESTLMLTGFPNRTDSTISRVDGGSPARQFTIAPAVTSFSFYANGTLYTKNAAQTKQWSDDEGLHYFYFDSSGVLQETTAVSESLITTYCIVAILYWDKTNSASIMFCDERHGYIMDNQTHLHFHSTLGCLWVSGLALNNITADGDGSSALHAEFGVDDGVVRDEDLEVAITGGSPQTLTRPAQIPIFWRTGASGYWRKKTADNYPCLYSGSGGYTGANGRIAWNQYTGGAWQLTEAGQNNCVLVHFFGTNNKSSSIVGEPFIGILGQYDYANATDARNAASTEINNILMSGLPTPEMTPIGSVIFQTNSSYANTPKAVVRSPSTGTTWVDFRGKKVNGTVAASSSPFLVSRNTALAHGSALTISYTGTPSGIRGYYKDSTNWAKDVMSYPRGFRRVKDATQFTADVIADIYNYSNDRMDACVLGDGTIAIAYYVAASKIYLKLVNGTTYALIAPPTPQVTASSQTSPSHFRVAPIKGTNNFVIVYAITGTKGKYRIYDNTGTAVTAELEFDGTACDYLSVGSFSTGNFVICWRNGTDIKFQIYNSSGVAVGVTTTIAIGSGFSVSCCVLTNDFFVIGARNAATNGALYVRDSTGASAMGATEYTGSIYAGAGLNRYVALPNKGFAVIWQNNTDNVNLMQRWKYVSDSSWVLIDTWQPWQEQANNVYGTFIHSDPTNRLTLVTLPEATRNAAGALSFLLYEEEEMSICSPNNELHSYIPWGQGPTLSGGPALGLLLSDRRIFLAYKDNTANDGKFIVIQQSHFKVVDNGSSVVLTNLTNQNQNVTLRVDL